MDEPRYLQATTLQCNQEGVFVLLEKSEGGKVANSIGLVCLQPTM